MKDVVRAILKKLGVDLEDVKISRIHEDLGNDLVVPTDDWNVAFEYEDSTIAIELNKVSSRDSWASLVKYYDGDMVSLVDRVELANMTPRELYEIIEEFIHKTGGEN